MCGFAGFVDLTAATDRRTLSDLARALAAPLAHRGPDDEGVWAEAALGVGLGFRRLSILDLTAAGHQPMVDRASGSVLAVNGEIYNHRELRRRLEASWCFAGESDSEVLLAALCRWGVATTLERVTGMFAFAFVDVPTSRLHLARDRFGEKPLHVARRGRSLAFASELKSFRALPWPSASLDRASAAAYFRYGYVPDPRTIFEGIERLEAGSYLTVPLGPSDAGREPTRHRYWSARVGMIEARSRPLAASTPELAERVDHAVGTAVTGRLQSDVPLGAFLSGGIDSSLIVAHLARARATPKTFTIGFPEAEFDESDAAATVARLLGTDHTCLEVSHSEAMAVIPELPALFDEPFADPSAVPTVLVARLAARSVTVVLSGDGGDELFGGYDRYRWADSIWRRTRAIPGPLRRGLADVLGAVPLGLWSAALALPGRAGVPGLDRIRPDHGRRIAGLLEAEDPPTLFRSLVSHWKDPARLVTCAREPATIFDAFTRDDAGLSPVEQFMVADTLGYLPGDILTKVDRATMAVSIEGRIPLLDPDLAALAWRLPAELRVTPGVGKPLLRAALHRHLPAEVVDRPKMGFGIPLGTWLRGPLRRWADDLLDPESLDHDEILDVRAIRKLWAEHLRGDRDGSYYLWDVLMFQAWRMHASP